MFRSPLDAIKNAAQSINYKIKLKRSGFKWYAKKILGFERFLSKIHDIGKNCLLVTSFKKLPHPLSIVLNRFWYFE